MNVTRVVQQHMRLYAAGALALLVSAGTAVAAPAISGVGNLNFGTWGGSLDMTAGTTACVYIPSGDGTRNYHISGTSQEGSYVMTSGSNSLAYSVDFSGKNVPYATPPVAYTNANTAASDCGGSPEQTLTLTVSSANLGNAKAGLYNGTLILIVEP